MTTKCDKLVIQAEHDLQLIREFLRGVKEKEIPGIRDFGAQMIDIYNRYHDAIESRSSGVFGDSAFANFIRNKKITQEDCSQLFLYQKLRYDLSPDHLANGYKRMMDVSDKMNKNKNKILYSNNGYVKHRIIRDLLNDFSAFCYKNERLKKLFSVGIEMFKNREDVCEKNQNGQITPLTKEQNEKIDALEKEFYTMLEEYNDQVLNEKGGLTNLYSSIRKLIIDKLCVYGGVKKDISETSFDKPFAIPERYRKKEKFNPYNYGKNKTVDEILFGSSSLSYTF